MNLNLLTPQAPGLSGLETEHSVIHFQEHHNASVAVKRVRVQSAHTIARWHTEVNVLRRVRGPEYVAMLLDSNAKDYSISLRCESGHSLDWYIDATTRRSTVTKEATSALWLDVASALAHVHSCGIVHDDVKPDNVIWDAGNRRAVLIDFGAAIMKDGHEDWPFSPSGTPSYAAPEFLNKQKGPLGDVWALGVTLLFAGGHMTLPDRNWFLPQVFGSGPDQLAMLAWLQEVELKRRQLDENDLLLVRMLDGDANKRITSSSLAAELNARQAP